MLDLNTIIPKQARFTVKRLDREFILKPFTIRDEVWCRDNLGDNFFNVFNDDSMDQRILYRMAFRLLEDKRDFVAKDEEQINEDGEKVTRKIGGYILFMDLFEGPVEKGQIANAVGECIGLSSPAPDENAPKKKATKK